MAYCFALIVLIVAFAATQAQEEFIVPKLFGNYTHSDLSSAPSCGTTMASYDGIPAKSNGAQQGTGSSCSSYGTYGYQYQCVEFVQRFMAKKHNTAPIWHANAKDMCANHPSGISKTSSPKPGDAVVFGWGTYGHTAIISSWSSSTVHVVEQNASPSGTNSYSTSSVECYLTAGGSSGSCSHKGYYCGNDGLGLSANNLYYCSGEGAKPTLSKDCGFTCTIMPKGQDDKCSSGSCSAVKTGYYCGGDKISGDKSTLYLCKDSKPAGAKYCSNGCHTASSGQDDYCN